MPFILKKKKKWCGIMWLGQNYVTLEVQVKFKSFSLGFIKHCVIEDRL